MNVFAAIQGLVPVLVSCGLLYLEEAGIPLPAPGEGVLIAAGVLMAAGVISPWIFFPLAFIATIGGALTGHAWAGLMGPLGARRLAERLHAGRAYDRVAQRLMSAGRWQICVARLIPGLRVYVSLVGGASGVSRRTFLAGVAPAAAAWVALFTLLGVVVGAPAFRLMGSAERAGLTIGLISLLAVLAFLAVRLIPPVQRHENAFVLTSRPWRLAVGLGLDIGVIACLMVGVTEVLEVALSFSDRHGIVFIALLLASVSIAYVAVGRRTVGATAGEIFLNVRYLPRPEPSTKDPAK
ncbi:MAG TPA: VTT domain-containing protein [Candidatus Dormibacteraeota bacterium]|nr:VTT domain-containing protein [Candidatus Dormibacteraeota bacterium]